MTRWEPIIQAAALTRFYRTGSCDPFLLARADLVALMCEVSGWTRPDIEQASPGFIRIQVRVHVPELRMQILVDEWVHPPPVVSSPP